MDQVFDVPSLREFSVKVCAENVHIIGDVRNLPKSTCEDILSAFMDSAQAKYATARRRFLAHFAPLGWSIQGAPYIYPVYGVQGEQDLIRVEYPDMLNFHQIECNEEMVQKIYEMTVQQDGAGGILDFPPNLKVLTIEGKDETFTPLYCQPDAIMQPSFDSRFETEQLFEMGPDQSLNSLILRKCKWIRLLGTDHISTLKSLSIIGCSSQNLMSLCSLKELVFLDLSCMTLRYFNPEIQMTLMLNNMPKLQHLDISLSNLDANILCSLYRTRSQENQLEFLGLYHTKYGACHLPNLPAKRVAGHANLQQVEEALRVYANDRRLIHVVVGESSRFEPMKLHSLIIQCIQNCNKLRLYGMHIVRAILDLLESMNWKAANRRIKQCTFQCLVNWCAGFPYGRTQLNALSSLFNFLHKNLYEKGFVHDKPALYGNYFAICFKLVLSVYSNRRIVNNMERIAEIYQECVRNSGQPAYMMMQHVCLPLVPIVEELRANANTTSHYKRNARVKRLVSYFLHCLEHNTQYFTRYPTEESNNQYA